MTFSKKVFEDGHPVLWLRNGIMESKAVPQTVKDHVRKLFKKQQRYGVDDDQAVLEALRITCRINIARTQEAMNKIDATSRHWLSLSKSMATWASLFIKFNKRNAIPSNGSKQTRAIPTTPLISAEDGDHEDSPDSDSDALES